MTHLLQVHQLNKSYKNSNFELNDISFTLNPGEVIGLIGKNGSGKSTLINTLVGNRFKDSGEISFFNQIISEKDKNYKVINFSILFKHLNYLKIIKFLLFLEECV